MLLRNISSLCARAALDKTSCQISGGRRCFALSAFVSSNTRFSIAIEDSDGLNGLEDLDCLVALVPEVSDVLIPGANGLSGPHPAKLSANARIASVENIRII